jgi:curved DNA-binding protein CbpA
MNTDPLENYYAILGVPGNADQETIKRAYRQLARRYHPDVAGPDGAVQMKRLNRAYAVLGDPEKRLQYDTLLGGTIDLRSGLTRPRRRARRVEAGDDLEFAGLSIFSTRGPLHAAATFHSSWGLVSALGSVRTADDLYIAASSLTGGGAIWSLQRQTLIAHLQTDPALAAESLRELRFSPQAQLLAGWGRLGLHLWETQNGALIWSHSLQARAVFDHYTLDLTFSQERGEEQPEVWVALPYLASDPRVPRKVGARATAVIRYRPAGPHHGASPEQELVCVEAELEQRQFWAIRLRALSRDGRSLLTLSCGHNPGQAEEVSIVRRWDLTAHTRFGNRLRPRIDSSILVGLCADCAPPYAVTPDLQSIAFTARAERDRVRVQNMRAATYRDLPVGTLGGTSRLALSEDASWLAVAREDSEVNEGVVEVWSPAENRLVQRLYHPWQISALHFAGQTLIVALTDGTIQLWTEGSA